jgi:hypothetical protein
MITPEALPVAPPRREIIAREPAEIEPSLVATCAIAGSTLSFVADTITLCGAPRRACFGQMAATSWSPPELASLAVASSLDARIVTRRAGVEVTAIVDAHVIAPHPRQVELVGGWFVPRFASIDLRAVHDTVATIAVRTSSDLAPVAPLVEDVACARLTTDAPAFYEGDIERAASLGGSPRPMYLPSALVEVRATANGPVVATLRASGQACSVYARDGARLRVLVAVEGGWVLGWFDDAGFTRRTSGSHYTHAPKVTQGAFVLGVTCPHDASIHVAIGRDHVHAATVTAGITFDPNDAAASLRAAGVTLDPSAHAAFDPDEIADCADPL